MFCEIYTRREGRLKATWYKEGIPVSVGPLGTVRGWVRRRGHERRNLCSDVTVVTTHLLTRVSVSSRAPSGSSGSPRGRVVCVHQQPDSTERGDGSHQVPRVSGRASSVLPLPQQAHC